MPQGLLVKGVKAAWRVQWELFMRELAPQSAGGSYSRPAYTFRGQIGDPDFPAEPGRYHVFVGNPCPWCHRVLLALAVLGLTPAVSFSMLVDDPERASRGGWVFEGRDPLFGCRDLRQAAGMGVAGGGKPAGETWPTGSPCPCHIHGQNVIQIAACAPLPCREVYTLLSPGFVGRCTAPLLVDTKARKIVCNESSLILRSLAGLRGWLGGTRVDLRPPELVADIDAWNDRLYEGLNNAVYRAGFATTQVC